MPEQPKSDQDRRTSKQESPSEEEETESSDLKEREYRDNQGQVHHHTKKYMEQHEGEEGGGKQDE